MFRGIRAFWKDQRGVALILFSVMLPAIVGFSALTIDMSRVNNLHNDMQKATDALALAAAAELNGRSDAWTRAENALANLLSNDTTFSDAGIVTLPGTGATTIDATYSACRSRGQISWCFLSSIPASDASMIATTNYAASASVTRFIMVEAQPETFSTIFPTSFLSGNSADNRFTLGAVSVAGFISGVCDFTPMFICNPYASQDALAASLTGHSRAMFALKKQSGGNNAQYGPGNYGFLQTPDGDLATPKITEMFAAVKPKACYSNDGVDTRPGNIPPVNDGINIRFDIYPNGNKYDPATYPPAPNVLKGMVVKNAGKSSCSYSAPSNGQESSYKALPRDTCLNNSNCNTPVPTRLGDGSWDRPGYFAVNHPGVTVASAGLDANASRYEVYKWEIANPNSHGSELTAPQCNTGSTDPKRRLINVAIVDCVANPVSGSGGNYPVQTFASFFLTEPAGGPPNADIYGEIVDITGRGGQGTLDNFLRDEAQLYR